MHTTFETRPNLRFSQIAAAVAAALVLTACGGGGGSSGGVRPNDPTVGAPSTGGGSGGSTNVPAPTPAPETNTPTPAPETDTPAPSPEPTPEPTPTPDAPVVTDPDTPLFIEPIAPPAPPVAPEAPTEPEAPAEPTEPESPTEPEVQQPTAEELEFGKNAFLGAINAQAAYDSVDGKVISGAGVTVAVIDSGVDAAHTEFNGRILQGKYFDGENNDQAMHDPDGHGTHVAGLIGAAKDGAGMHGVAFGATILPVGVAPVALAEQTFSDIFEYARANGAKVYNNSWAMDLDINSLADRAAAEAFLPNLSQTLKRVAEEGGVVVFAAGNEAATDPQFWARLPEKLDYLKENWIAVVAVDETGKLATYSNACGTSETATWCLAAPGGGFETSIYSTVPNQNYGMQSGTSMASPIVSGSVAVLMERFPTLTGDQIVDRLFVSANKTGEYADTTLYGQGLLDLGAAANPIGGLFVPTSTSIHGEVASLESAAISMSPQMAEQMKAQLAGQSVLAVDGFQRAPFQIEAASLVTSSDDKSEKIADKMSRQAGRETLTASNGAKFGYRQSNGSEMVMVANLANGSTMMMASDAPYAAIEQAMGGLNLAPAAIQDHLSPRLNESHRSMAFGYAAPIGADWKMGVMGYGGNLNNAEESASTGMGVSFARQMGDVGMSLSFSAQQGETANMMARLGADKGDVSQAGFKAMMTYRPTESLEMFGLLDLGLARSNTSTSGVFSMAEKRSNLALAFGASQAMGNFVVSGLYRFEQGGRSEMSLTMPGWVKADGSVLMNSTKVSLKEDEVHAAALHFEGKLDRAGMMRMGAGLSARTDGRHEAMLTYNLKF